MPCHSPIHDCIHSYIIIRLFTMIWECKVLFTCLGAEQQILCLFYGTVNKHLSEFKCCDTNFNKTRDLFFLTINNIKSKWSVLRRYSHESSLMSLKYVLLCYVRAENFLYYAYRDQRRLCLSDSFCHFFLYRKAKLKCKNVYEVLCLCSKVH